MTHQLISSRCNSTVLLNLLEKNLYQMLCLQAWTGDMIYIFIKSGWGYYQTIRPSDHQTIRPHTFNNYLTPVEKEKRYFNRNFLAVVQN